MNRKIENVPVVLPPALDLEEAELAARNEFLAKNEISDREDFEALGNDSEGADDIILDETPDTVSEENEAKNLRRAKRRKSVIFLMIFGAGFVIFVVFISWAFGFGFFAPPKRVSVDRNQSPNGANSSPNTSGDEKLKTALSLVANETGDNQNSPVISDDSTNPNALAEQDLTLSSDGKTSEQSNTQPAGNMIVLPNENSSLQSNGTQNQVRANQPIPQGIINTTPNLLNQEVLDINSIVQQKNNNNGNANLSDKSDGAVARSVFFGRVTNQNNSVSQSSSNTGGNVSVRNTALSNESANVPAFGTLLPVRFLGAVYSLRGSGGLVRMELSRTVKQTGFSYPAGTVLVGKMRGSEYNRAFISVIGAIDPKTGKLVKFEGDVMGIDGASGVIGTRKSVKSWGARFLNALRETGSQAVNVLASRGGRGGTIVLGVTNGITGEVSRVVPGSSETDSFVVIKAGTEAYILITDLPDEQPTDDSNGVDKLAGNDSQIPGINLSESEMAEILVSNDANKIRAAMLKMSPNERALAIKAMEAGK